MKRKKAEAPVVPVLGYRYRGGKLYCTGLYNAADPEDAKILRKLDPEVAELRKEAQRQAAAKLRDAIQKRKEARRQKVAGLGPGIVALVRQAPPAPDTWEVVAAPAPEETTEEA